MAKKKDRQPEQSPTAQPLPPPAQPAEVPVSNTRIWTFWIGVALTVILARTLDAALPGVSESVIERWVMLGFGAFLAIFLIKLK